MADIHYFVSVTNGNDANDGLTVATAWKTLTKAAITVPSPVDGFNNYIHFAPGVYREKFIPANSGASATSKIVFKGDPRCVYFVNEVQGKCRITGTDAQEMPTTGAVLDWTGRTNVELCNCQVDGSQTAGSTSVFAITNIPICRNVQVLSVGGFSNCVCYNCKTLCSYKGFVNCMSYNCIVVGGSYGFDSNTLYNCIVIGGSVGFNTVTAAYNCVAIGCGSGYNNSTAYNCVAIGCGSGSSGSAMYNYNIVNCDTSVGSSSVLAGCKSVYARTALPANVIAMKHIDVDILPSVIANLLNINPNGLNKGNIPLIVSSLSIAYAINLIVERDLVFTPSQTGICLGASILIASKTVSGNITVALQKYIGSVWTTQKSKTLPVALIDTTEYTFFEWDTTSDIGDNNLTTDANTWRIAIISDLEASATTLYGANATTPGCMANIIPSWGNYDALGQPVKTSMIIGAYDIAMVTLDQTLYHTDAPSVKINGSGVKTLKLPVKKNVPVTVSYWVRHDGAIAEMEPILVLSGNDISEVTDTHSVGANTWEQLSVNITPPADDVINVSLIARDSSKNAWFSDPTVV